VAVEGSAFDAEHVGDLLDRVIAFVVEPLGLLNLVRCEFGPATAFAPACSSCCQTVAGVRSDEFALELGEHREHAEHGSTFWCAGVDALFDDLQSDFSVLQVGAEVHKMEHRSPETIKASDDNRVAGAEQLEDRVELWS